MFTTTCESFIAIKLRVCAPIRDRHTYIDSKHGQKNNLFEVSQPANHFREIEKYLM